MDTNFERIAVIKFTNKDQLILPCEGAELFLDEGDVCGKITFRNIPPDSGDLHEKFFYFSFLFKDREGHCLSYNSTITCHPFLFEDGVIAEEYFDLPGDDYALSTEVLLDDRVSFNVNLKNEDEDIELTEIHFHNLFAEMNVFYVNGSFDVYIWFHGEYDLGIKYNIPLSKLFWHKGDVFYGSDIEPQSSDYYNIKQVNFDDDLNLNTNLVYK